MKKGGLFTIVMILTIFFGCQGGKLQSVPDELLGVWKPAESRYADRSLEFRRNAIIFGIGEEEYDNYTINYVKIQKDRDGKSTVYTIYYEDDAEEEYILAFYYYPEDNGVIRVQYQEYIVWEKEG